MEFFSFKKKIESPFYIKSMQEVILVLEKSLFLPENTEFLVRSNFDKIVKL